MSILNESIFPSLPPYVPTGIYTSTFVYGTDSIGNIPWIYQVLWDMWGLLPWIYMGSAVPPIFSGGGNQPAEQTQPEQGGGQQGSGGQQESGGQQGTEGQQETVPTYRQDVYGRRPVEGRGSTGGQTVYIPVGGIPTFRVDVIGRQDPANRQEPVKQEPEKQEPEKQEEENRPPTFVVDVYGRPIEGTRRLPPGYPPAYIPTGGIPTFTVEAIGTSPYTRILPIDLPPSVPPKQPETALPIPTPPATAPPVTAPPTTAPPITPASQQPGGQQSGGQPRPSVSLPSIPMDGGAPMPGQIAGPVGTETVLRSLFDLMTKVRVIQSLGEILGNMGYGGHDVYPTSA